MPPRLKAILLLALFLLKTVLRRLFTNRKSGIAAFRANYDADGLPPVSSAEREEMPAFSRCIACGLCDRGEASRIEASGGAYRGVMALVLAGSRSMPDYRAAAYSFSFVSDDVLAEKEKICPTGVPFRAIARFVRDKASAVGGALPLPARIDSLPPSSEST
jgi:succinate dehydrogenase/fumarate reductase-like Fe-S protein